MSGLDEAWSVGTGRDITFSSLPPGRYRLEATFVNEALGARAPVVSVAIAVRPPWWRTAPFMALVAVVAACLFWVAYAWRMRSVAARQLALERLVAERTRELEASREQLRELALKDGLTGAWNRRALMELGAKELARAARGADVVTLLIVDADHFKRINDVHGHLAGDAVLREIARRLQSAIRAGDMLGRYGGEEFVLLLPGLRLDRPEDLGRVERLRGIVGEQPIALEDGTALTVTCSVGAVTARPQAATSLEDLIGRADEALYAAKRNGRDRVEVVPGIVDIGGELPREPAPACALRGAS
jgi:diguanylate cyclase (GGDEF)-like protein